MNKLIPGELYRVKETMLFMFQHNHKLCPDNNPGELLVFIKLSWGDFLYHDLASVVFLDKNGALIMNAMREAGLQRTIYDKLEGPIIFHE
jgi:hypothetical protein